MKLLAHILIGSLTLLQVYEVPGEKVKVGTDEKVEATIVVDENNRVNGYVEDADKTKFFSGKKEVVGEWKPNGVIEVKDKYGYKYNLKASGAKRAGERRTYGYDYRAHKQHHYGKTKGTD